MSTDLFHEAFFFLSRHEAEKLRLVCRSFDALCDGLRDVHGYKLQIDWMDVGRTDDWTSGPLEYIAKVHAYDQLHEIRGSEEVLATGLKAALSVSLVHHVSIYTSALSESLCGESAAFFGGVSAHTVYLVWDEQSTYYDTVTSSKLWDFLLSFDAIEEELRFNYTKFLEDDLADDFILRCRAKRMQTLTLSLDLELRLQEASEDELLNQFHRKKLDAKSSLISTSRTA